MDGQPAQREFFSKSYQEARQRFYDASNELQWAGTSHPIAAKGPNGEDLTIDVSISSEWQPKTLVLCSGLHGVEGYFGSAVQLAVMQAVADGQLVIPNATRLALLHALNPYGFAWNRRANEDNVDLNRNCIIIPPDAYAGSPDGYAEADPLINPQSPPGLFDFFKSKLNKLAAKVGQEKLRTAIASGQYEYPRGLFFGGKAPSETLKIMRQEINQWIPDNSSAAAVLDFHSGLGNYGELNLLTAATRKDFQDTVLAQKFDAAKVKCLDSNEGEYPTRGSLLSWFGKFQFAPQFFAFAAEFGTYDPLRVLGTLRAENRCHWQEKPGSPATHATRSEMREVFCPADPQWRQKVIASSVALVKQSLEILDTCPAWTGRK